MSSRRGWPHRPPPPGQAYRLRAYISNGVIRHEEYSVGVWVGYRFVVRWRWRTADSAIICRAYSAAISRGRRPRLWFSVAARTVATASTVSGEIAVACWYNSAPRARASAASWTASKEAPNSDDNSLLRRGSRNLRNPDKRVSRVGNNLQLVAMGHFRPRNAAPV